MTDEHPIKSIEDVNHWRDLGRQGYLMLEGSLASGATLSDAMNVLTAFYRGMFEAVQKQGTED